MAQSSALIDGAHVTIAGSGSPALVFVHGYACDATDWAAQRTDLASVAKVVTCDLPAHGRSEGFAQQPSIRAAGRAVARVIEELALDPVILVGHSMGCRVVLECFRAASHRIAGVVLLDGSRIASGDPAAAADRMATQLTGDGYAAFMLRFFNGMFVSTSDARVHRAVLERAMRFPDDVGRALLIDISRWDAGEMDAALASVIVPVLVIQSTTLDESHERVSLQSEADSAWLEHVRSQLPAARVATIGDAGHFPHIEDAEEVTTLIRAFHAEIATHSRTREPGRA
jgi:pimeloyl-ACP methyl ester carboxylesterase